MRRKNLYAACLLFLGTTLSFLFLSAEYGYSSTVVSVIDGHSTCAQCHGRFPGDPGTEKSGKAAQPAKIPADKIDLLCMGCHGPAGIARTKANIHGRQTYVEKPVGCVGCHDPHNNPPNYVNGQNIKLIGSNRSSVHATINTPNSGERLVVFESRGTDVGEPSMYSFADDNEDRDGYYSGICEVCHTQTKYHRNSAAGKHSHYTGQTCTNCHTHINQFLAFAETLGSSAELSGTVVDDSGYAWAGITLFLDINGNGVWDEGEPIAVTDENGHFVFKGINNKGYAILVMPGSIPDGYDVKISLKGYVAVVTTTAQPAAVEGYVWRDKNLSGLHDAGDTGIPGVRLFADLNDNNTPDADEPAAMTDTLGFYSLGGLALGEYVVQVDASTIPDGYKLVTSNLPLQVKFAPPGELLVQADFGYRRQLDVDPNSGTLKYPVRVAWTPDGGYCVTDTLVNAVFLHDGSGALTGQLRGLNKPLGIIVDAQGRIYVGNNGDNTVKVYNAEGKAVKIIGEHDLMMPNDLALDREQNLYVLDSQIKQVKVYNSNGHYLRHIGDGGAGNGLFTFPIAMAINYRMVNNVETGELFVADKRSSRIQVFDLSGKYLRSFGGPVRQSMGRWRVDGLFNSIQSIAFDQHGRLHVLDSYMDEVQILDPVTGKFLSRYSAFVDATGPNLQLDLDISPDGRVIMTNVGTRSVELIYTVQ